MAATLATGLLRTWQFRRKVLLAWAIVLLGALGLTAAGFIAANRNVSTQLSRTQVELNAAARQVVDQLQAIAGQGGTADTLPGAGGALLDVNLAERPGMEGGVWAEQGGFLTYVYPTYDGSTPKTQLPAAELPRIEALARRAIASKELEQESVVGEREALVRVAQAFDVDGVALVVWIMKRVPVGSAQLLTQGAMAAGALLLVIVLTGLWLAWFLSRWNSALTQMRAALAVRPLEDLPTVPAFHERELDDIGTAINALSSDLRASKAEAARLTIRLTSAERLAALGRVSAALAHEIRNPIATIRLRAENALANAAVSSPQTLNRIMEEVDRLERLVRSLLELGREIQLRAERVELSKWVQQLLASSQPRAAAKNVRIGSEVTGAEWSFDPVHLGRAVDAMLSNALEFAPDDSEIRLQVSIAGEELHLTVRDQGPGIPADLQARVFEPFFTTRPEGTGLGLALAKETAEAHGGEIRVVSSQPGARIEMRIPWLASW